MHALRNNCANSCWAIAAALAAVLAAGCTSNPSVPLVPYVPSNSPAMTTPKLIYPVARETNQIDDYHGVKVADPYRWLEDPDSAETRAWVEAENKVTFDYLAKIPQRTALRERLTQLWNFERYGIPQREGGRYFYTRNDGLQNQSVLYAAESLEGTPKVLLDPNT